MKSSALQQRRTATSSSSSSSSTSGNGGITSGANGSGGKRIWNEATSLQQQQDDNKKKQQNPVSSLFSRRVVVVGSGGVGVGVGGGGGGGGGGVGVGVGENGIIGGRKRQIVVSTRTFVGLVVLGVSLWLLLPAWIAHNSTSSLGDHLRRPALMKKTKVEPLIKPQQHPNSPIQKQQPQKQQQQQQQQEAEEPQPRPGQKFKSIADAVVAAAVAATNHQHHDHDGSDGSDGFDDYDHDNQDEFHHHDPNRRNNKAPTPHPIPDDPHGMDTDHKQQQRQHRSDPRREPYEAADAPNTDNDNGNDNHNDNEQENPPSSDRNTQEEDSPSRASSAAVPDGGGSGSGSGGKKASSLAALESRYVHHGPVTTKEDEVVDMRDLNQNLAFDNPDGGVWKQGWDVEPVLVDEDHPLEIYVVPHSHCDPGWIKTFDEYFQQQTKGILTTVVDALAADPKRKFIWAEMSYLEWWWREQTSAVKRVVKNLLRSGQLEIVTGGWVQPDEANTQLYAMEIQLQEGLEFIKTELGPEFLPRYGWSIDPFGYSPTMAYLLRKYGYDAMLIQRVHYAVKRELAEHQQLEFMWRQTWDDKGEHDIFTHTMPFFSYDVPHTCGPDPSVCCQFDFARLGRFGGCPWHKEPKHITEQNVEERSLLLLDQYKKKASLYRAGKQHDRGSNTARNVVLAPLGDDFRYMSSKEAEDQFRNYQKIFDYLNGNVPGVSAQFGTLSDYFNAVMGTFDVPVLKGSFFTYADRDQDYWSGYFTSRVFDKALDRQLERVLFAAQSLGATEADLQGPRRALSLFQHHDGVTGTAKDHVVRDYAQRIHTAIRTCQDWILRYVDRVALATDDGAGAGADRKATIGGPRQPCWQSDAPRGLSQNLCGHVTPRDENENDNNHSNNAGRTNTEVVLYNPLPTVQWCGTTKVSPHGIAKTPFYPCDQPGGVNPGSSSKFEFDPITGLMTHPIKEQWMVWKVDKGGAYLFYPGVLEEYGKPSSSTKTSQFGGIPHLFQRRIGQPPPATPDEPEISYGGYVVKTRHWKRTVVEKRVSAENFGPDVASSALVLDFIYETNLQTSNEEWLVRFNTDGGIANQGVFHTDLNGFNFDTHRFREDMPIQSQVFPMPTLASIEDENMRLTVLSEHAQGTASLKEGTVDVWLDRRLFGDDGRGLGQGVKDNVPTRTRLRVVMETEGYDKSAGTDPPGSDARRRDVEDHHYREQPPPPPPRPEFEITPLCRRMWEELNHPLEAFGKIVHPTAEDAAAAAEDDDPSSDAGGNNNIKKKRKKKVVDDVVDGPNMEFPYMIPNKAVLDEDDEEFPIVPFVFMVYKRVDYFIQAIESMRQSDFDADRVPIIVSQDGDVPEMTRYVESLRGEFPLLHVMVHPFSCHDHPHEFPGDDKSLNDGYDGDSYGNLRTWQITCCKHHFTWMIKTVYGLTEEELGVDPSLVHSFAFLEEDYIVANNIYENMRRGMHVLRTSPDRERLMALVFDPSDAQTRPLKPFKDHGWFVKGFVSGPIVLSRDMFDRFLTGADEFCLYDDYNWDWSIVHLTNRGFLPRYVLTPTQPLVKHIGLADGLHEVTEKDGKLRRAQRFQLPVDFSGTTYYPLNVEWTNVRKPKPFGGWGHPKDHLHCQQVLGVEWVNHA